MLTKCFSRINNDLITACSKAYSAEEFTVSLPHLFKLHAAEVRHGGQEVFVTTLNRRKLIVVLHSVFYSFSLVLHGGKDSKLSTVTEWMNE